MNVFKNTLMLLVALLISSTLPVYAKHSFPSYKGECPDDRLYVPLASCPSRKMLLDGFYLGGQIGYDTYWVRQNISTPARSDIVANPKINAANWVEGVVAGFGKYFCEPFYIGAEVFFNYSQASESYFIETIAGHYSSKISARSSYGFAVFPGIGITDSLLIYLRLGYTWGSFLANESFLNLTARKTNTVSGPNYGLGMEALITSYWSLRGEYSHTNHSSFSTTFATNFDPSDNQVMVTLIYHISPCTC